MKLNLYLPDQVGERAKAAMPDLNLSGLLRAAVEHELQRRERLAAMAADAQEYELELLTEEGKDYIGVATGRKVGDDTYLTADGRLILYDREEGDYQALRLDEVDDLESIEGRFKSFNDYATVCA